MEIKEQPKRANLSDLLGRHPDHFRSLRAIVEGRSPVDVRRPIDEISGNGIFSCHDGTPRPGYRPSCERHSATHPMGPVVVDSPGPDPSEVMPSS